MGWSVNAPLRSHIYSPVRAEPVPEKLAEPDAVLLRAARNVRERGWLSGDWGWSGGPQCVQGHIHTAINEEGEEVISYPAHSNILAKSLGGHNSTSNIKWNNAPERTAEEVAEALERAAYGV